MGLTGVVSTLTNMRLMQSALAQNTNLTDYKALIVLFLFGGANTDNMLIPRSGHPSRANYLAGRGVLGISNAELSGHGINADNLRDPVTNDLTAEARFAVNPALGTRVNNQPGTCVKDIFNAGNLSFVANVGTLVDQTIKTGNLQFSAPAPPQLFSHADQQVQWQSALPDKPFQSGWAGRVADLMTSGGSNPDSRVSMSVSLSGLNSLLVGLPGAPTQYSVTSNGAISLAGYGTNYSGALNDPGDIYSYKNNTSGRRLEAFQKIMDFTHANLMEDYYNTVVKRARENEGFIGESIAESNASTVNFDDIFLAQHGLSLGGSTNGLPSVAKQLLMIAKLIAGRDSLGNNRQLFFASQGGYDTHQSQGTPGSPGDFNGLMSDLNNSLAAFNQSMEQLAAADPDFDHSDYTLATHSDFNRTFNPNGTDVASAGSDHGWGGHHIVMGGGVKGHNVYGYYPDQLINGPLDVNDANGRGRWIPTTSVEQFSSPLAKWMGVNINGDSSIIGSEMHTIFPNLDRFANPFQSNYSPNDPLSNANLDFML